MGRPLPAVFLAGLNPATWIRDDGCSQRGIPDTDNDEVKGSFKARDSPNKKPIRGERRGVST